MGKSSPDHLLDNAGDSGDERKVAPGDEADGVEQCLPPDQLLYKAGDKERQSQAVKSMVG